MEIRQLETFIAVAEEAHFTRAAQRLHLAQPGVSATIRALEQELGAVLFVRTTRRVELTEAGRNFLVEARRALAAVQRARDTVDAVQGLLRGRLNVGHSQLAHSFTPNGPLIAVLGQFHERYPGIEIRFHEAPAFELIEGIREGRLDIAFLGLINPSPPGLSVTPLAAGELALICPPSHPLAERETVTFNDLADAPFVDFLAKGVVRHYVDHAFFAAQCERRTVVEVETMTSAVQLVAAGFGVSIIPRQLAKEYPEVRTVALWPEITLPFVAVTAEAPPVSAAARMLLAMCLAD